MRYKAQILNLIEEYEPEQIFNTLCNNEEHRVSFFKEFKRKNEIYFGGTTVYYEIRTKIKDKLLFKEWAITVIQNVKERRTQELNQMMYIETVLGLIFNKRRYA